MKIRRRTANLGPLRFSVALYRDTFGSFLRVTGWWRPRAGS